MLEVQELTKYFGGLAAVHDVNLHIDQGEILGLIGPNGAGKTTIFNLISGSMHPTSGVVRFKGEDITKLSPYQVCRRNIARTFQSIKLFPYMTALETAMLGSVFGASANMAKAKEEAMASLEFVGLSSKAKGLAGDLTIAEQKRLEVARALATKPELLLLDEVMAGLNQTELEPAIELVRRINRIGITIFMIEHVMHVIMGVSNRIIVLHNGTTLCEGTPDQVCADNEVIKIYLGE